MTHLLCQHSLSAFCVPGMMLGGGDTERGSTQACSRAPGWEGEADILTEKLRVCKRRVCAMIEASADRPERTETEHLTWGREVKEAFTKKLTFLLR